MSASHNPWRSTLLVAIQMGSIAAILLSGPLLAHHPLLLGLELLGGGVGIWALLVMRRDTFSVLPDVKRGARFVAEGPYRWIRHPMYLAVLVVTGALVADSFSWWRLAFWLLLTVDILIKIAHEERLLSRHYPTYARYRGQTKRLLPYLY